MTAPSTDDLHIGRRLRERRKLLNYTAEQFASKIGVSKQQLQKYESGVNRISAQMLFKCSQMLGVEPSFFLKDLPILNIHEPAPEAREVLENPETVKLIKNYIAISDSRVRLTIVDLVASIRKIKVK